MKLNEFDAEGMLREFKRNGLIQVLTPTTDEHGPKVYKWSPRGLAMLKQWGRPNQ